MLAHWRVHFSILSQAVAAADQNSKPASESHGQGGGGGGDILLSLPSLLSDIVLHEYCHTR